MVSLEAILTTYVRIRAHEFWKHTLCYYVVRFFLKPVKKLCRMVFAPIRYGFSWIERNVPLFLISMLAFGLLCLLELIGFGIGSIGFIFALTQRPDIIYAILYIISDTTNLAHISTGQIRLNLSHNFLN